MAVRLRRWLSFVLVAILILYSLHVFAWPNWPAVLQVPQSTAWKPRPQRQRGEPNDPFEWRNVPLLHPVTSMIPLPTGQPLKIPQIQHNFAERVSAAKDKVRKERLAAVKDAFVHAWQGYRKQAWLHDEIRPLSGQAHDPFGGWGATLVDTLDTLWIMGMEKDFSVAVAALDQIDFAKCAISNVNIFETTIRYLGGFLGAYDVSQGQYPKLLEKAVEVGEMLYLAFDTENHMPMTRWNWRRGAAGEAHDPPPSALVAELGSLSLEFTRLTQLTGDPKYYDVVQRISDLFESSQNQTKLPGLWPVTVNLQTPDLTQDSAFTIGGMADSAFEYLPKNWLLHQGRLDQSRTMYLTALEAMKTWLIFEPLVPPSTDALARPAPLMLGSMHVGGNAANSLKNFDPQGQHLTCFAAGMFALAARALSATQPASSTAGDLELGVRVAEGCLWSYGATTSGLGPELYRTYPCRRGLDAVTKGDAADWAGARGDCTWSRSGWLAGLAMQQGGDKDWEQFAGEQRLREGFTQVTDPRYILRPETIESLFVLYRITGDAAYQDQAWRMFEAMVRHCRTEWAFAALADVTRERPPQFDSMESFFTAETLKYYYLIFAEPGLVSLDEYVLNTEAHPFRWRKI